MSASDGRSSRGLVFRLYAVGLVQLLLVAVAAAAIGAVVARLPARLDMPRLTQRLAQVQPSDLGRELRAIGDRNDVQLSLFEQDGTLVATNVEPPLAFPRWGAPPPGGHGPGFDRFPPDGPPPGPPPDRGPPSLPPPGGPGLGMPPFGPPPGGEPPHPHPVAAEVDVGGHPDVLVARWGRPKPSGLPPLLTLLAGFVVVGAGAWLTARWIARPLDQLARAARALGEGDLRARANLPGSDVLADVGRTFDVMAGRIAVLLVAEKELLANVSHELRTPLSRIRVALDLAAEGDGDAARAAMAEIGIDLEELETLLNDVLDAARLGIQTDGPSLQTGFALHLGEHDPLGIARAAAERFRTHHPTRALEVDEEKGLASVRADPVLFRRVLDNLLENAHKYTPDQAAPIRLRIGRDERGVRFEVVDLGIGITREDLPHVFTPFFRAERSRSRGTGGVGLGLTLVKRITDAHGGTIRVESDDDHGTTVSVTLPRSEAPASAPG